MKRECQNICQIECQIECVRLSQRIDVGILTANENARNDARQMSEYMSVRVRIRLSDIVPAIMADNMPAKCHVRMNMRQIDCRNTYEIKCQVYNARQNVR